MIDPTISETIEEHALYGWFHAAAALESDQFDWSLHEIGDALCSVSSSEPSILVNRVLGLGSQAEPSLEQLVEIRELYADHGVSRFFLHVLPEALGSEKDALLTAAGYERYRGWMKFSRGPGEVRPITTDLAIREISTDEAMDFAEIVALGFDFEPAFQPAIAALIDDPDWILFMSFDGDTPAGTGGLYLRDRIGYLDFAATHPDFRRRGAQSGVLSARLNYAFGAGCNTIVTMTGEAVPGDEQHSYRNIERAGFSEAYVRENWIPAGS